MKNSYKKFDGLAFDIINYIILTLLVIITVYPFYYILIYSISDTSMIHSGVTFLPAGFSLQSYKDVFALRGMASGAVVSLTRTVLGTLLTVICSTFFSYIVTKKELIFRKSIYRFVIVSMYFNAGFIPWYLTMKALGLRNNFLVYILPGAVTAFYIILIKTFIEQMPPALEESAKIDGAGYITIFVKIIFPLSKPIIATIAVFCAVAQWNAWTDNFFLVENPKLTTLQLILYNYLSQSQAISRASSRELTQGGIVRQLSPQAIKMTMTMVVTLPILLVYPFMQRYFVKGIMMGAVKG
ncbi:MAG TPA: carbohydrate ABC transporter permease [Ruminiclostridium sp.]